MNQSGNLFIELQPPAGGMQRLRQTLESQPRRTLSSGWRFATGAIAMSVLAATWLLPDVMAQHRQTDALVESMRDAVAPLNGGLYVVNGAAVELPSSQSNVRLFLVQSTPAADPLKQASPPE